MSDCLHGYFLGVGCPQCPQPDTSNMHPVQRALVALMVEILRTEDSPQRQRDLRMIYGMRYHYPFEIESEPERANMVADEEAPTDEEAIKEWCACNPFFQEEVVALRSIHSGLSLDDFRDHPDVEALLERYYEWLADQ